MKYSKIVLTYSTMNIFFVDLPNDRIETEINFLYFENEMVGYIPTKNKKYWGKKIKEVYVIEAQYTIIKLNNDINVLRDNIERCKNG